jgi:hypothetical protein
MKLRLNGRQLRLTAAYRLIFTAWVLGWGILFGTVLSLILLISLISGSMMVNGDMVEGRLEVLLALLPMLILFPLAIVFQGAIFTGLLVLGLLVYRQFKPIEIVVDQKAPASSPPARS